MGQSGVVMRAARRLALLATFSLALTACTTGSFTPGSAVDTARVLNAVDSDDVQYVRGAVQAGVLNPNQRIAAPAYPDGAPLIAVAARSGSIEILRYLISAGANLNARTPVNETALMLAAFFYDTELQGTARAFERHEKAVRLLVEAGAELENPYRYTPLAYAAYQGNDRVVRYLLERGARVNIDARNGQTYVNTPLMMAAIQGNEHIARALLRAGADADIRVIGGHTASELAAKYRHAALARLLQCAERHAAYSLSGECVALLGYDPRRASAGNR
jgi:hypothetical protein